jgi:hypothetical protein
MPATLGSFYWLGFETSGHSPDKKRLAWLGAQRPGSGNGEREASMPQKMPFEPLPASVLFALVVGAGVGHG